MSDKNVTLQKKATEKIDTVERIRSGKVFTPPVDIYESAEEVVLLVDMPGVDEKSIDITLEQNILTLQGRVESLAPEGFTLNYQEYETGDYLRSFTLSDTVEREKISASYKDGVLQLHLPKAEPAKPKKLP